MPNNTRRTLREFWNAIQPKKPFTQPIHVGMRMFKSGVVVFITILFCALIGRGTTNTFLALVTAIIAMQDTVEHSLRLGLHRLYGTAIGGVFGILFVALMMLLPFESNMLFRAFYLGCSTIVVIMLCVWFSIKEAAVIANVVLLAILLNEEVSTSFAYAFNRMLDTVIGVVISIIVNLTIRPPKWK